MKQFGVERVKKLSSEAKQIKIIRDPEYLLATQP